MSACEQHHLRWLCLWSREGGEGRISCTGHGHKSHPFNQAGDTWLLHIRSHLRGQGHLPGVSHSSLGMCPGGSIIHTQEDTAWHVCSGLPELLPALASSTDIQSQPYTAGFMCCFHGVGKKTIPGSPTVPQGRAGAGAQTHTAASRLGQARGSA